MTPTPSARTPPGPRGGPFGARHAIRSQIDILQFMTDLGRYGDMAYFAVGPFRAYLVNHPDLLRELLIAKSDLIQKLPYQRMVMGQIEGDGLLASEGEHWRKQRRLLQPAFHANRIAALADKAVAETMQRIANWRDGESIDAIAEMTDLAMVIMAKSFFGLDINSEAPHFRAAMRHISEAFLIEMRTMVRLPRWLPTPKARRKWRAIDAIDEVIWDLVRRERGSTAENDNLLAILLRAVDPESGAPAMTEKDARDETVTMFRSHDTTAAVLAWIICMLAHRPDVAERIESEVATVLGGRAPNAGDMRALAYTEMVVLETMRLYPPTWSLFTREAMEPFELGGYAIPKGGWLMAMPWVTHRDPRFFAEPLKFDPERFAPHRAGEMQRFAYFPFGIGGHTCTGMRLVTVEMVLMVAALCQQCRFTLADPSHSVAVEALLSIWPKGKLNVTVHRRPRACANSVPCHAHPQKTAIE
ncbi:MAG: cytochrome P450 [Reyranellaceae bacterium]